MAKIKEKAEGVGQKIQGRTDNNVSSSNQSPVHTTKASPSMGRRGSPKFNVTTEHEMNLTMEIAQLFMSCLHAWGLDQDLDKLCVSKLGLLKPKCPISFGLISRSGHMSLMLPGWHKKVCREYENPELVKLGNPTTDGTMTLKQQARSASYNMPEKLRDPLRPEGVSADLSTDSDHENEPMPGEQNRRQSSQTGLSPMLEEMKLFSTRARWQISSGVTTQHLLSVISTANTLMSMGHATFIQRRVLKKPKRYCKVPVNIFWGLGPVHFKLSV